MANEDKDVVVATDEVVIDKDVTTEDAADDTHDDSGDTTGKAVETPEARKARLERQLNQLGKKHPELFEKKEVKTSSKQSDELDYGKKAFLVANGIKDGAEMKLVKEIAKETGKSLEDVLGSKYFQAELKEMRELNNTSAAIPTGKRTGTSGVDTVDYWIAKGELPPKDQVDLRRAVVNARIAKDKSKSPFYNA